MSLLEARHPKAIDLGLERCREVWERLGAPRIAPRTFVVAGTNGKGSTVATICGLLDGLGYRYGSYTTPHLYRYNERVQVGRSAVGDGALLDAFDRVEAARGDTSLTYFEFGTLAAFCILADAQPEFAVLEVGLGGRLDAVNLVDADCAVITPIGLDHQEYLGNDRESIGREKAGIIRRGRPVVCGDEAPPASVREVAAHLDAPLLCYGRDFGVERLAASLRYRFGERVLDLPLPTLPGSHQPANLATGLTAVLTLVPEAAADIEGLRRGLRSVRLPGRFQKMREQPSLWIDVGHNPLAADAVAASLRELRSEGAIRRCRCVLATLADKDAAGVAGALAGVVTDWYCAPTAGSRGQTAQALADRIRPAPGVSAPRVFDSVAGALEAALADSEATDGVLVFGSFLTAAEAGRHLIGSEIS